MEPMDHPGVSRVYDVVEQWKDGREITKPELAALLSFVLYGENVLSQLGRPSTGFSVRHSEWETMLTVRTCHDGVHEVVFVSGRTIVDCVRVFWKKLCADALEWRFDRYRNT